MTSPTTRADFTCGAVGAQAHLRHLEQDAALHRLEAVAGVGQGARVDDRVGVLEERALHLGGDVDVDDVFDDVLGWDVGGRGATRHRWCSSGPDCGAATIVDRARRPHGPRRAGGRTSLQDMADVADGRPRVPGGVGGGRRAARRVDHARPPDPAQRRGRAAGVPRRPVRTVDLPAVLRRDGAAARAGPAAAGQRRPRRPGRAGRRRGRRRDRADHRCRAVRPDRRRRRRGRVQRRRRAPGPRPGVGAARAPRRRRPGTRRRPVRRRGPAAERPDDRRVPGGRATWCSSAPRTASSR